MPELEIERNEAAVAKPEVVTTFADAAVKDGARIRPPRYKTMIVTPVDERLADMAARIETIQQRLARAFVDMAGEIRATRGFVSDKRLRQFLVSECGVDPSEMSAYFRFEKALGHAIPPLTEGLVSFSAIKALAVSPAEVRDDAIDAVRGGQSLSARDVLAIRRRVREKHVDLQAKFERDRARTLKKASRRLVDNKIADFRNRALAFATDLIDFYNAGFEETPVWNETLQTTKAGLQKSAATLLKKFRETFDVASLPEEWLYDYHGTPADDVALARAHDALRNLAAGMFQQWDARYDVPFDTSHDYLDRTFVESVAWLCDGAEVPARRTPAQARESVRLLEPSVRLQSLEICAGGGGQAIGLHAAGFDALGIYEIKPDAVETLKQNHLLGPVHCANVREVDFRKYAGRLDLVAGGVPCQSHSTLGLRLGRHDGRDLFLEAVRLVEETKPRAFFFENVSGFAMSRNSSYRAELHERFKDLGYESRVFSFWGKDYGLPQGRPRVALVGFRDGQMERFRMPPVLTPEPVKLGDALFDIVAKNGWEGARAWADKANVLGPTIVGASDRSGRLGFSSNFQRKEWERLDVDPVGIADGSPMPGHIGPFKLSLEMGARI